MSEPENVVYNLDIIGNLNVLFDNDTPFTSIYIQFNKRSRFG